jgi:NAD(P)-dependent dehydrogenase (short-subunit alcohol dehydrogenase family)
MAFAAEGARVLVNDVGRPIIGERDGRGLYSTVHDSSAAEEVVRRITERGGIAVTNTTDVASVERAASVVHAAIEAFGDVHIVINNAAGADDTDIDDVDDARLDAHFAVNVKSTAGTTKAAFEVMQRIGHGGSIINTFSSFGSVTPSRGLVAGSRPLLDHVAYNIAKFGVISSTLQAATAGKPLGIRVNAYAPTAPGTPMSRRWITLAGLLAPDDEAAFEHMSPERNSPLVVFLASDAASDITGRMFMHIPTSISSNAQFRIMEVFVAETKGAIADAWTVESIERTWSSIARMTASEGAWISSLDGGQSIAIDSIRSTVIAAADSDIAFDT